MAKLCHCLRFLSFLRFLEFLDILGYKFPSTYRIFKEIQVFLVFCRDRVSPYLPRDACDVCPREVSDKFPWISRCTLYSLLVG